VSVHFEAARHLDCTLGFIRKAGALAGVVLNPATPVSVLEDVIEVADYVPTHERKPRVWGPEADPYVLEKVAEARQVAGVRRS